MNLSTELEDLLTLLASSLPLVRAHRYIDWASNLDRGGSVFEVNKASTLGSLHLSSE